MTTIQQAIEQDHEAICALDQLVLGNSSRQAYLEHAIQSGQCWIAWSDDVPAGFAVLEQSFFEQGFLALLIVHPAHRRQGIATALIHHIEAICPTAKLFTSTNQSNLAMQRVCEAAGFVQSGWVDNLDEGDPEIIYFKRVHTS